MSTVIEKWDEILGIVKRSTIFPMFDSTHG